MKLRVFRGPTVAAAMTAVRHALGADALILETRDASGAIEILAVDTPPSGAEDMPSIDNGPAPLIVPPANGSALDERRQNLIWHGISDALLPMLLEHDLPHAVTKSVRFGDLPLAAGAAPLFFTGEPGAGKSLSVIKVATRLVLEGRCPMVISADGRKAGAVEQLAAMTQLLGLTLIVADDPNHLRRALSRREAGAPVLIDGPGLIAGSADDEDLLRDLTTAAAAEIVLVLPAGLHIDEASEIASRHAELGAKRIVASRLDVSRRIGGIIQPAWRSGLILTEAGIGPGAADGLRPITAAMLAERLGTRGHTTDPVGSAASNHARLLSKTEKGTSHGS